MYPSTRRLPRRSLTLLAALLTTSFAVLCLTPSVPAQVKKTKPPTPAEVEKRPLTHNDYDIWHTIQAPVISPNGSFVAYTLTSPDDDNELIVREVTSGKDFRHSRGRFAAKGGENKVAFTADSARVVFTIAPSKADPKKADKDKETPRASLGIMDLSTGKVTILEGVRTFLLPEEKAHFVIYHRLPPGAVIAEKKTDEDDDDDVVDPSGDFFLQTKGKAKKGGEGKQQVTPTKTPSDLVVHSFAFERDAAIIPDVTDFTLARDGKVLICAVAGKTTEDTGVFGYAIAESKGKAPKAEVRFKLPINIGKAKYSRFVWDENQRFFAFFADWSAAGKPGPLSLFAWDRDNTSGKDGVPAPAFEMLNSKKTAGLKDGCVLTERGGLSFSEDSSKIFLGVAPPSTAETKEMTKSGAKDAKGALVELWHWKDDFIQPMQKVRGNQDKQRTFAAVLHLKTDKLLQIADSKMPTASFSRDGNYALGSDDAPYRSLVAYDGNYSDIYLVKTADGSRKPLLKKHHWGISFSPGGKYGIFYDGTDWNTVALSSGTIVNITKKTKVPTKFANEDHDSPSPAPSYGICGWSNDDRFVYLYDKYDIWELSPTGSSQRCCTGGIGRKSGIQFRYTKLDPKEKSINNQKPMLLHIESLHSRETGFFTYDPQSGKVPHILRIGDASLSLPTKAKHADKLLLTSQTFYDNPNLFVVSQDFKLAWPISDANPHKKNFIWGKSHLVHYKSADGVPLQGVLITPENFDPEKKYPMIVYIYEKLSQNLHHFVVPKEGTSINPTYYASNGYLVFMPDIVYTIGYPGQSALKCVLPGIQTIIDRGIVDENAIGIQGHSWGGYQIAYMVTQTNRFKAAAAGAAVSNMTSAYDGIRWGTGLPRQFQYEKTQSRIGGTLWEFPMRFVENSPVFMADRVKTPIMLLNNDQDDAVPWYQGIEYYLALRRLGKEVYMFNYPGEKHGLAKKANKLDYTIRMQEFFDHHLRGQPAPQWMTKGIPYTPRPATKGDPTGGGD